MMYNFKYIDTSEFTEQELNDMIDVILMFQSSHIPLTNEEQIE